MSTQLEAVVEAVVHAVGERLGDKDPKLVQLVVREVVAALTAPSAAGEARAAEASVAPSTPLTDGHRAVVTASGLNCKGVVAGIASQIADAGGDIQDISQTIVSDFFTMIMVVDIVDLGVSFAQFKEMMRVEAERLGVHVVVVHEDVMRALQRI